MKILKALSLFSILAFLLCLIAATTPDLPWQPPQVDASLVGDGSVGDPLGADYSKFVVEVDQATTAAPTLTVIHNEVATIDTIIRTSAGLYTIWFDGNPLTDDETYISCTIGNATAAISKAYSVTDSTLVVKFYTEAAVAADLGGNAYLEARVLKE